MTVWIAAADALTFTSLHDALKLHPVQVHQAPANLRDGLPALVLLDLALYVDDEVKWESFRARFAGEVAVFYRCDWCQKEKAALQVLRSRRIRCFSLPIPDDVLHELFLHILNPPGLNDCQSTQSSR